MTELATAMLEGIAIVQARNRGDCDTLNQLVDGTCPRRLAHVLANIVIELAIDDQVDLDRWLEAFRGSVIDTASDWGTP